MLSQTPTAGLKVAMVSSWKLLTSTTTRSTVEPLSTCPIRGLPILPPTKTRSPERVSISPKRAVVVVLPLVPVTASSGLRKKRAASSISPTTATPRRRASARGSRVWGTPGLRTIRSAVAKAAGLWPPSSSRTPKRSRAAARSPI